MTATIKTDRSRIETYQRCPRRRFLEYEMDRNLDECIVQDDGTEAPMVGGYVANKPQFALETGSGFHKGMEVVLSCLKQGQPPSSTVRFPIIIDEAVRAGVKEYEKEILPYFDHIKRRESSPTENVIFDDADDADEPFTSYAVDEGRAMVEGLIRAYCAADSGLKALLSEYEILDVEQEIDVPLDKCQCCNGTSWVPVVPHEIIEIEGVEGALRQTDCPQCNGTGGSVILMARPDGILRSRADNQLYVLSFKTTSTWDKRKQRQGDYDTQGMSEIIAAEFKYGEKFAGVQMVYAVKSYKSQDKLDNLWKHNSGLIRPYFKSGVVSEDDQYGFAYNYVDDRGNNKRLSGWERVDLWKQGPDAIKDWIEKLANSNDPTCNPDYLDTTVVMPEVYYRNESDMEEWRQSVIFQESWIKHSMDEIQRSQNNALHNVGEIQLATLFPKYRHSCTYPTPCPMIQICHEGMDVFNGAFKPRVANHPQEIEK